MTQIIELEPASFDRKGVMPDTAAEAVYSSFAQEFRLRIADSLLEPDFDPSSVVPQLHEVVEEHKGKVVAATIRHESNYTSDRFKPLHRYLGALSAQPETGNDIAVSDEFVDDLHSQLDGLDQDFSLLGEWHKKLSNTEIRRLTADINTLCQTTNPGIGDWLRDAYSLVSYATKNPNEFTIQPEDLDALYLVTFMPHPARALVRRMIIGNVMMDQIQRELGETTEEEAAALQALQQFYIADAMSGQQWDDLIKRYPDENLEDLSVAMAKFSADQLSALGKLQKLILSGNATRVGEAWQTVREKLQEKIEAVHKESGLSFWQLQDIGHCFSGFGDWDLQRAFDTTGQTDRLFEFGEEHKTGLKAFVLEDDLEQQARCVQVIESHTSYATSEELTFTRIEEVKESFEDPEIGLFVIDIQNGEDKTAGIRLAKQVLDMVMERSSEEDAPSEMPRIKIILWSASVQAVMEANNFFKELIESHPRKRSISHSLFEGGGSSWGGAPINIDIRLKRWSSVSDTQ